MSASDDPTDEMARFLSTHNAERLFDGDALPFDDLPAEVGPLANLFASLAAPDMEQDPRAEADAVATIAAAIRTAASQPRPLPTGQARFSRIPERVAAAVLVAVLASGTAVAAAATGSLPGPIQRAVSITLSHFDISVPRPGHHAHVGPTAPKHRARTAPHDAGVPAKVPPLPANSDHGLCPAAAHTGAPGDSGKSQSTSVASSNLQRAAAAAGMRVTDQCQVGGRRGAGAATTTSTLPLTRKTGRPPTSAPHGPTVSLPAHGNPHTTTPPANGNGNGNGNGKANAIGQGKTQGITNGHANGNSQSKP